MGAKARRGDDFDVRIVDGVRNDWTYTVRDDEQGLRLDRFLAGRLSWRSRSSARRLVDDGRVTLDDRSARPNRKVRAGETVTIALPVPRRERDLGRGADAVPLPRLLEDDDLIALDKPAGVPVHPSGRLLHRTVITSLHREYRDFDDPSRDVIPKLCHRLDLETSGVLLVAKHHRALTFVQGQFEARSVGKEYLVLVHGAVEGDEGLIDLPLGPSLGGAVRNRRAVRFDVGQPARTRWRVVQRWRDYTQLHIDLLTGRHHQIRAHLAALGHPVVGDKIYGRDETAFIRYTEDALTEDDLRLLELPRQALHSHALTFEHPRQGSLRLTSPWPPDLVAFCEGLA